MTITIGFLGAGFISRTHNFFLKHCPVDHRIVAVHDPDCDKARSLAERHGADVVSEDELLDRVDVAFVTAWTSEHERLVASAAQRGVAVFCEKPLAFDAAGAARMVDSVDRAGVASHVGLVLRALPQFLYVHELLADERAGQVVSVNFRDDQFIPVQGHYGSTWRTEPSLCGRGTLLEHSIHDVDILRHLLGPVRAVSGVVREFHGHDQIDDLAVARLEFASGSVASLTSIWHDMVARPSQRLIEIFTERLYVRLDGTPEGDLVWQFDGDDERSLQGHDLANACVDAGLARPDEVLGTRGGAMFNPLTPFLDSVRSGGAPPLPLGAALPAHHLVDAIYASAERDGAPVAVDA